MVLAGCRDAAAHMHIAGVAAGKAEIGRSMLERLASAGADLLEDEPEVGVVLRVVEDELLAAVERLERIVRDHQFRADIGVTFG